MKNYKVGHIGFSLVFHYRFSGKLDDFEAFRSNLRTSVTIDLYEGEEMQTKLKLTKNKRDFIANETIREKGFSIKTDLFKGSFNGRDRFCLYLYRPYSTYPLNIRNAVRLCMGIYALVHKQGIFLHSSSLVKRNNAYLFFGLPESGKSTITRFGKEIGLCTQGDEFIFIFKEKDAYFSYATPFGGNVSPDVKKARLKEIYWIKKGKSFCTRNIPPENMIPEMTQNELVCMGTKIEGTRLKTNAFRLISGICKHVKFGELTFPYNNEFLRELVI